MEKNNLFLTHKNKSGLSYKDLGDKISHSRIYAHQLISSPGASNMINTLIELGKHIGMDRDMVISEWRRMRAEHDAQVAERRIGKNGSMYHRGKV